MHIQWLGHSCFRLQDKIGPDGLTVITDPFDKKTGLKPPHFEATVVTVSHDHGDHNNIADIRGNPYVIKTAGEYDIRGILIEGVQSFHDAANGRERGKNIIYRIELDGLVVVHLGDLGSVLDDKQTGRLAGADILLVPVGGKYTIDAQKAVEVVSQIEPRIVIPMHYKIPGLAFDIDPVDKFIKEMGIKPRTEEKLRIAKKDLPQEDTEVILLKA